MSNDESDLIPYTAPASLFNDPLPEGKPAVPELSVLLDQDKVQSFHCNNSVESEKPDLQNRYEMSKPRSNTVTSKDKPDSYHTWKAKHAEELNKITSSSRKLDMNSKRHSNSKKSSELQFNTSSSKGVHTVKKSSVVSSFPNVAMNGYNSQNYAPNRSDFQGIDQSNFVQDPSNSFNYTHSNSPYENMPPRQNYQQRNLPHDENVNQINYQNRYMPQGSNGQMQNFSYPLALPHPIDQRTNSYQTMNQLPVQSCHQGMTFHPNSTHQYPSGDLRNPNAPGVLGDTSSLTQTIQELYQVVQLQNQQVNAAIAMLQLQVKQLQLGLGTEKDISVEQGDACRNCSCGQKSKDNVVANSCSSPKKKLGKDFSNKKIQVSPKRSVGVMANIAECDEEELSEISEAVLERTCKQSRQRFQHKKEAKQVAKKSSSNRDKKSPKTLEEPKTSKAKKNYNPPQEKKQSKKPTQKSNAQNYHSTNATKKVHNESEDDEESPDEDLESSNPSIHINLQDYSSSNDSDSDSWSGSDNSVSQSGTASEEESSAPKLGWTFYNQIVDQVNNIVKKDSPKTDHASGSRKILPTGRKEDYETENNWSKRVTFHGPPPSSSDDFMMNMMPQAHFQPILGNQEYKDYQPSGPPERMQDLRMYNVANGNTNMSFTTLRYLERFDLLPPQFNSKRQDQQQYQQQDYQRPRHADLKHKKTHSEGYPQTTTQTNPRRRLRDSRR